MLTLRELRRPELQERLAQGLTVATGPFRFRIQSCLPGVVRGLAQLYADFPVDDDVGFRDFHVQVDAMPGVRGLWFRVYQR